MRHTEFKRGERVKLKDRYALSLMDSNSNRSVNWLNRRGTVNHCNKSAVLITWDGRHSFDNVPIQGVERASDNEDQF